MRGLGDMGTTAMGRVWIEYEGERQRAVYMAHNDSLLTGNGTRIPFGIVVRDGARDALSVSLDGTSSTFANMGGALG